ncbi:MAG: ABC transporter ATP-binding protein [Deltaproteobacteria bacterium]|nr:ABC transporter ATP-binding protein [Deltaproteobacteria bacterium]MBW2020127.1 ABC transporter ATP-binding protein [Deltaproteobacteria bacterium]MBW2074980.1 ABC transporter ATP-binding protein [Deltaproteobacteria bacterium]
MIKVRNLSCGYGKKIVLKDISFEVKTGQFVGVIGPNGSGKTTIIRAISGLLPPQKGVVSLEGKTISGIGRKALAVKVAVVTQSPEATPPFSVEEFILLGRVPHWSRFQLLETKKDVKITEKVMELTGIRSLRGRKMRELSGGERQLAYLARALAQEPSLLLLDEPTAHLDIGHQVQIMRLLKRLNDKALTIIVVLHNLNLASLYCQRLVLLNKGRLRQVGHPKEVLTEEIINEVYETSIIVKEDPGTSLPLVFPVYQR